MNYISAHEIANKWGISKRRVQALCAANRIKNAKRIGNMWVVPVNATKPKDARYKDIVNAIPTKYSNPIKKARSQIKAISEKMFYSIISENYSPENAKLISVSIFAIELLTFISSRNSISLNYININNIVASVLTYDIEIPTHLREKFSKDIFEVISENPFCLDDSLAWFYQYTNKYIADASFSSTQFFTEKYMIASLVDATNFSTVDGKILDPACGGGNFLLYCFDVLYEKEIAAEDSKLDVISKIENIISRLYGYEIDTTLAAVAYINLIVKILLKLSEYGHTINISDFKYITPNIFYSINDSFIGALDCKKSEHQVCRIGSKDVTSMEEIFRNASFIFTNPPFQTIKGMPSQLKEYLKEYYPNTKCDMCNAFIDMSITLLDKDGMAGLVTQNSWLYLDSFVNFRKSVLSRCSIESIIELGSNAFYDLSGEKANIALLLFNKFNNKCNDIKLISVKNLTQQNCEQLLSAANDLGEYTRIVSQNKILNSSSVQFDMFSSKRLEYIMNNFPCYGEYAVPMQGTSTGDAKSLLDYHWMHIDDADWVPVSKGGGYSRWQGLNYYSVKWGTNGEYIRSQAGSAIRNANYFKETELVFSDTGTAGLNVRILLPGQLFVASGPGIRLKQGNMYAHLAFLNSRIASYYIRLLSPKLTIAAGYISKLPVIENLLFSPLLAENSKACLIEKRKRLRKRPLNIEFSLEGYQSKKQNIPDCAFEWFLEDITSEWNQLCREEAISNEIEHAFNLCEEDIRIIEGQVGKKLVYALNDEIVFFEDIEDIITKYLDANCMLTRVRVSKLALGSDGILEFLSQKTGYSCETLFKFLILRSNFRNNIETLYENFFLHTIILDIVGLGKMQNKIGIDVDKLTEKVIIKYPNLKLQSTVICSWIRKSFTQTHKEAFQNKPLYVYSDITDSIINLGGDTFE